MGPAPPQRGPPAFHTPRGVPQPQAPPYPPTPVPLPQPLSSPREHGGAGCRGRCLSTSEQAERLLAASRWNLPRLPGRWPKRMPEQGEFQARPRPRPAGPCPSGHFIQRAAEKEGGLPRGEEGQAAALEPTGATSSTQGTARLPEPRQTPDGPCSPGARRPPSKLCHKATQAPPGSSSVGPSQSWPGTTPGRQALLTAGTVPPLQGAGAGRSGSTEWWREHGTEATSQHELTPLSRSPPASRPSERQRFRQRRGPGPQPRTAEDERQ